MGHLQVLDLDFLDDCGWLKSVNNAHGMFWKSDSSTMATQSDLGLRSVTMEKVSH